MWILECFLNLFTVASLAFERVSILLPMNMKNLYHFLSKLISIYLQPQVDSDSSTTVLQSADKIYLIFWAYLTQFLSKL